MHGSSRLDGLDRLEHAARQVAELDFGWMKEGVLLLGPQVLGGLYLVDVNARQVPAVRTGVGAKLVGCFRERDVHARFAAFESSQEKLQAERRLSGTGVALHEMDPVYGKSSAKQVVEATDTRRGCLRRWMRSVISRHLPSVQTFTVWLSAIEPQVSRFAASEVPEFVLVETTEVYVPKTARSARQDQLPAVLTGGSRRIQFARSAAATAASQALMTRNRSDSCTSNSH